MYPASANTSMHRFLLARRYGELPAFSHHWKNSPLHAGRAAPPSAPPETSVVKISAWSQHRFPSLPRSINKNPVAAILLLQQPRDPEFSASILRCPFSRLESRLLLRFTEAIFQ